MVSTPRYLRGIHDTNGDLISGTTNDDGGEGRNSRLIFIATETGTHYVVAGAYSSRQGTYELEVTEAVSDDTRDGAKDLGDITDLDGPRFPNASLNGNGDQVDYFRFTLTEAKEVGLGLRQQDADADLFLGDADGNVLYSSTVDGTANEAITETLLAGTYYVRVESQEAGNNQFKLRYGVSAPDQDEVARLEQRQQGGTNEAPAFAEASYAFDLAENADGSTNRVALGTVSATDPEDATLTYSIEGGNDARLFEEVDDLLLRIIQGFGITRDSTTGNVQKFRQGLRIRQEPSLHRAHGDSKAHTGCGVRQPLPAQDWRAILGWLERLVPIEIDEHEPRRTTRSVVVSTDIAFQAILPSLDIYPVDAGTGLVDELSHHGFVRLPFHCRRDEYRARRVHVSPNRASRYVPSGWVQGITMSPSGIPPSNRSRIS